MNLEFVGVRDAGDIDKERVVLKAQSDIDVGKYMLIRSGMKDGKITTGITDTFWFPDLPIKSGDLVVIYTKSGKRNDKEFSDFHSYFFYWGKKEPLWVETDVGGAVMYVQTWKKFLPG